jgi:tRNA1Val (adenine37-N6)-methyltransferase
MRISEKFDFKQFTVYHDQATMKVGTDAVLLGAWAELNQAKRILDIGTGSGVIALMMAQRSSAQTTIEAIEITTGDCKQAIENVARSPWPSKIQIHQISLQQFQAEQFDLILSNPPYFNNSYKPPISERTNARHTETLSHLELLDHSKRLLKPNGSLNVILPITEGNQIKTLAEDKGWYNTRKCVFRSRASKPLERILLELKLDKQELETDELCLYENALDWSSGYKALTKGFYL